jgi:hypothetical protein
VDSASEHATGCTLMIAVAPLARMLPSSSRIVGGFGSMAMTWPPGPTTGAAMSE